MSLYWSQLGFDSGLCHLHRPNFLCLVSGVCRCLGFCHRVFFLSLYWVFSPDFVLYVCVVTWLCQPNHPYVLGFLTGFCHNLMFFHWILFHPFALSLIFVTIRGLCPALQGYINKTRTQYRIWQMRFLPVGASI